ncbi:MAG: bifunctional hydroxymethylpyrimidine kinase/phosphomethylpyrimidine kinase [Terriglobales bacterium]
MSGPAAGPPLVLAIAGFDPTSGAGVSADIKTISANQAYGIACITALTIQDSQGARGYRNVPAAFFEEQLDCLLSDLPPSAVKIGMLGSQETVEVVARQLKRHNSPWVVLDPIFAATSGSALSDENSWSLMRKRLFPLTSVLTPNLAEAERLTGLKLEKPADAEQAARALHQMGPRYVVIKGGHWERPVDVLYDGDQITILAADRVRTAHTHGTGCTFSAALAANLANGHPVHDAVVMAKAYLTAALKQSFAIGTGPGPVNHLYRLHESQPSRNVDPAPLIEFTTR